MNEAIIRMNKVSPSQSEFTRTLARMAETYKATILHGDVAAAGSAAKSCRQDERIPKCALCSIVR
jgi:hypothetical protein